jgi:hypothetical protein
LDIEARDVLLVFKVNAQLGRVSLCACGARFGHAGMGDYVQ